MNKRRFPVGCLFYLLILVVGVLFAVYSLNRLDDADHRSDMAEKKNKEIMKIIPTDAAKLNQEFLQHFFNYDSTAERYKGVESLMTKLGYSSLFPSEGPDIPTDTGFSIVSRMEGLKAYEYQSERTKIEFISEFSASTTYNSSTTSQTVLVRTTLINPDGRGWKVNDFEFIGDLTGRNEK